MQVQHDHALTGARADVAAWDTSRPEVLRIALEFQSEDLEGHLRRAREAQIREEMRQKWERTTADAWARATEWNISEPEKLAESLRWLEYHCKKSISTEEAKACRQLVARAKALCAELDPAKPQDVLQAIGFLKRIPADLAGLMRCDDRSGFIYEPPISPVLG
jgi:hypothetical protein